MLNDIFSSKQSPHAWVTACDGEHRHCSICGEQQMYLDGDEWRGLYWETTHAGERQAHALSTPAITRSWPWSGIAALAVSIFSRRASR